MEFHLEEFSSFAHEAPYSLALHSSIGCGGVARACFYPKSVNEAVSLLQAFEKRGVPYYMVGNMTNILPADGGTNKALISTKCLTEIKFGEYTYVGAGVTSGAFLRGCKKAELGGCEFLAGIPCTLGGALYMNAGAAGRYIAELLDSVLVYTQGELKTLPVKECGYAYKTSRFMTDKSVILGGTLRLQETSVEEIEKSKRAYMEKRAHLPKGKSMGCVFKNPKGVFAGALIEGAGLKGLRNGGARISEEHANFIINEGGCSAAEIKALIQTIKNAVFSQYGVALEEEIQYLE